MKIYMLEELFDKLAKKLKITNVHQSASSIEIILPNDILSKLKVTDLFVDVSNISRKFKFNMRGRNLVITLNLINLEKHFVYYLVDLVNLLQKNYN